METTPTSVAQDISAIESSKVDNAALVTTEISSKDGEKSPTESKGALSVAELVALTDLINDSAVRNYQFIHFSHSISPTG